MSTTKQSLNVMIIINLPNNSDVTVSVRPLTPEKMSGVLMHSFTLLGVEYSLEEAIAISGFLGYVVASPQGSKLMTTPIHYDTKGRPFSLLAVCFTTAQ